MGDSRKRPGSPGHTSSARRRQANDEMNAHRMLGAITAAVVVVAAVTSSVTHTVIASNIRRSINERSRRFDWGITAKTSTSAAPTVFGLSTGCVRRPLKNLQIYGVPSLTPTAPSRPPFPCTPLDEMISCIHHQQCCIEREFVLPTISHSRSPIAQSGSKIACRYHFQVDYELYACDILFSSSKMRECPFCYL